jgi:GNAT superfamily N-acetyltransferase
MAQGTYHLLIPPVPFSTRHLHKWISLRLLALKTNPEAFGSTYEEGLEKTEEMWRRRLDDGKEKVEMVVVYRPNGVHLGDEVEYDHGGGEEDSEEWVALLACVSPTALAAEQNHPLPFFQAVRMEYGPDSNLAPFALFSMWVHPSHRGRGLGRMLIDGAEEWARGHCARTSISTASDQEEEGSSTSKLKKPVIVLDVYVSNQSAIKMYEAYGFKLFEGEDPEGLEEGMIIMMKMLKLEASLERRSDHE